MHKFHFHCLHYYYNIGHLKLQRMQDSVYWWQFLCGIVTITGILLYKILTYTITNAIYFDCKIYGLEVSSKLDSYFPIKICFNCFNLKSFKNDEKCFFNFILKVLFVLKIFKFLFWLSGHVEKAAWLERKR